MLVDGSSLIFRAFFGVPQTVRAPDGRPVNAVRGFLDNLARLLTERRPRRLAVASDEEWRPRGRVDPIPPHQAHSGPRPGPPRPVPPLPLRHAVPGAVGGT